MSYRWLVIPTILAVLAGGCAAKDETINNRRVLQYPITVTEYSDIVHPGGIEADIEVSPLRYLALRDFNRDGDLDTAYVTFAGDFVMGFPEKQRKGLEELYHSIFVAFKERQNKEHS